MSQGLTILEVILVVLILAIITAMIAPGLIQSLSNYELSTEAKKLRSKIRYAQQLAIAIQATYQISFDTGDESYTIIYDPDDAAQTIETLELEKNISIDDPTDFTNNKINFDQFGSPSEGGDLTLSDPKGNSTTISIETATGKVTIE